MRYLILILLLIGCSNKITPEQVNKCANISAAVKFDYSISDTGECVLKKKFYGSEYTYWIPIEQTDGAMRIIDLQKDMARAPLLKVCMDRCEAKMPKQVCPGDNALHTQNCGGYCDHRVPK